MRITFINHDGSGFADKIDIPEGTTIRELFGQKLPHGKPSDYLIRVNRQPTTADSVLLPGDRVSITPTKIEGAVEEEERGKRRGKRILPCDRSFPLSSVPRPPDLCPKGTPMGARQRLNSIYLTGMLTLAALVGMLTESWGLFLLVGLALIALQTHSGNIRPGPTSRPRRRSRR